MSEAGELSALAQEGVNTALQLLVVLIICFFGYLLIGRKRASFLEFLGLVPPAKGSMQLAFFVGVIFSALTIGMFYAFPTLHEAAGADNTVGGQIRQNGFSGETIAIILLVALVKTAFAEELLFRGLIAKRLINLLGMAVGNTLHAFLFGAVHFIIFAVPGGPAFDPMLALAIGGIPTAIAWAMAWINETRGGGSIAPSWLVHAIGNVSAYFVAAFG